MRWWWHKPQLQPTSTLTPEMVLKALPEAAHSLIVRLGPGPVSTPYYWQLRRHDQVRDLALITVAMPEREANVPLTADELLAFAQEADAEDLVPMALLAVPKHALNPSILTRLAHGMKPHGQQVFVVVPVGVLYDFLANATPDGQPMIPTVGELLDGWPMRQAATLTAYVLDETVAPSLLAVPLPAEEAVTFTTWQEVDPTVMALFQGPLRRVAHAKHGGTFVFTDLQ